MISTKVEYNGEPFYVQSSGRYYSSGRKNAGERLLHRRVWSDTHGAIPDGMCVHHINGDWADNRLENLELKDRAEHQSEHVREWLQDPSYKEKVLAGLRNGKEKAKEWHKSEEGRRWHAAHGEVTWQAKEKEPAKCSVCSQEYMTYFKSRSRFCSRACEQKEGYVRRKTAKGRCEYCGGAFNYSKYRLQRCCSRACANKLRVINQGKTE